MIEIVLEFLTSDQPAALVSKLAILVSTLSSLLTMFIDERKVNKYFKPIMAILNSVALNRLFNKNATDK